MLSIPGGVGNCDLSSISERRTRKGQDLRDRTHDFPGRMLGAL